LASLLFPPATAIGSSGESPKAIKIGAEDLPRMRWSHMEGHSEWSDDALRALQQHGRSLTEMVPGDIDSWCPYYREADEVTRQAFWVGFMSALAKHESTYKPWAVGGGGKWFGLLQIAPATARGYKCQAGTGEALKDGGANLSCAIRIMAVTVPRDGVVAGHDGKWRGVAADWGPMRSEAKRTDMANWLKAQPFCQGSIAPVEANARITPVSVER
jgi:hypothetical protein